MQKEFSKRKNGWHEYQIQDKENEVGKRLGRREKIMYAIQKRKFKLFLITQCYFDDQNLTCTVNLYIISRTSYHYT